MLYKFTEREEIILISDANEMFLLIMLERIRLIGFESTGRLTLCLSAVFLANGKQNLEDLNSSGYFGL